MELTGATCLKARLRHTLKGTEMLTHIGDFIADMYAVVTRQERVMKAAKHNRCPKCRTHQVELIGSVKIGRWKCRCCKHKWVWEPITLIRSNSN